MTSMSPLVMGAFVLLLLAIYRYIIYPAFLSSLAKIPNASSLTPYTPLWILWIRLRGRENRTIYEAHRQYGPVVRLGPKEVSINIVSDGLRIVYDGNFDKHDWYPNLFANYGVLNLFTTKDAKAHRERKRMGSTIYTKSHLQSSPDMEKFSKILISHRFLPILQEAAITGATIDVHELNSALAMDFITAHLFGLGAGSDFLRNVEYRKRWLALYQATKAHWVTIAELKGPVQMMSKLGINLVPNYVFRNFSELGLWCLSMCAAASAPQETSETALSTKAVAYDHMVLGLEKSDKRASSHPRDLEIASEMLDHINAGHETIAITLTYLMYELSRRPALQSELRVELQTLSPQITHPATSNDLPSPRSLDALPLLDALINETLRLYSAVQGPQARVTPAKCKSIGGYSNIPAGMRISASAYSLHRNTTVFPEPEVFNPSRWLQGKEARNEMFKWLFAFGSGARKCLGIHFAHQELKLVVAAVYTNYRTTIGEESDMLQADGAIGFPLGNKLLLNFQHVAPKV